MQVAHSLGAKKEENARAISHEAFTGSLCFGVILMLLFMLLSYYIPLWLGADEEILADARRYLFFYAAGIPFQTLLTVFSAVLRCAGDTRTPMFVNVGSNFANVVLNFLLIFETRRLVIFGKTCTVYGAGWGVAGAAIATALSYMIAAVVLLTIMFLRASPVQLRRVPCRLSRAVTSRTIRLGLPVALERVATSSGQLVMTGLVTSLGNIALSANHVAVTAEAISYLPANGIVQGMRPLIGYNYGAREHVRVRALYRYTLALCASIMAFGMLLCQILPGHLIGLFTANPGTIAAGSTALRLISLDFIISAVSVASSGALEGLGKGAASLVISLCRNLLVILPCAWIFSSTLGSIGVWYAFPCAELITALIALIVYKKSVMRQN